MDDDKDNLASALSIRSYNARSIGKNPKRRHILHYIKEKNDDINIIVDTRFSKNIENKVKADWGGHAFFSSFSSEARGVAIFIKKGLAIDILDKRADDQGNLLSLLIKFNGKKILVSGLYGPNTDDPDFYKNEAFSLIDEWDPEFPILGGDWNLVLNQTADTHNYQNENNINARREVVKQMETHSLIDPWRELNPDSKRFTYHHQGSNPKKLSRLDFFLISQSLFPYVTKTGIQAGIQSDHSFITLQIDFNRFIKGRGYWKLNNSLLRVLAYRDIVKRSINHITLQYAVNNDISEEGIQNLNSEEIQNIPVSICPKLFFEALLLDIRGETIKFASAKKKTK